MIRWGGHAERGLATVQSILGFAMALVVLTFAANVVAMHYTRGALRAAVVAGVRAGALVGGTAEVCEVRAEAVLRGDSGLLRGPYGSNALVECSLVDERIEASGSATVSWWIDVLPPMVLRVSAEAVVEGLPSADPTDLPPWNGWLPSGS